MKVRVLMFGALAQAASRDSFIVVEEGATVRDVISAVRELYPDAQSILDRASVAVNHEIVDDTRRIDSADEIALLPPSSGGGNAISVRLCEAPSVATALGAVATDGAGGTALFVGTVRNTGASGPVTCLEYSAYDVMAEKVMTEIGTEATEKWRLAGLAIEHAIGRRGAGEITFVVACSAPHRDEAFEACRYVVDEVKRRAPVWKKEIGPWGERWIGS